MYREVVPDERHVSPEVFEGIPDAAALTTLNFVEHTTREHRDAHVE